MLFVSICLGEKEPSCVWVDPHINIKTYTGVIVCVCVCFSANTVSGENVKLVFLVPLGDHWQLIQILYLLMIGINFLTSVCR